MAIDEDLIKRLDALVNVLGSLATGLQQNSAQSTQAVAQSTQAVTQARLAAQAARASAGDASKAAADLVKAFAAIDGKAAPTDQAISQRRTGLQYEFLGALLGRRDDRDRPLFSYPAKATRAGTAITLGAPVPKGAALVNVFGATNVDTELALAEGNSATLVKIGVGEAIRAVEVLDQHGFPLAYQFC